MGNKLKKQQVEIWIKRWQGQKNYWRAARNLQQQIAEQLDFLNTFVEDRLGYNDQYTIYIKKNHNEWGYSPHESFETGIIKNIDWYFANETW